MSILTHQSVFSATLQDGPFAVEDDPPLPHPFSREAKQWVSKIHDNQLLKTKYRSVRNQIFDLLGINTFDDVITSYSIHYTKLYESSVVATVLMCSHEFV